MLLKMYDMFDDMSIYIDENKERLALRNIERLRMANHISLTGLIIMLMISYLSYKTFKWHPCFIILPLFFILSIVVSSFVKKHFGKDYGKARIFCSLYYLIYVGLAAYFDYTAPSITNTYWTPIVFFFITATYVDYYHLVALLYFLFLIIYYVDYFVFTGSGETGGSLMLINCSFIISLFCYGLNLSVQTDRGADSREYKEQSITDQLTGLLNKVAFSNAAKRFLERRGTVPGGSLIILDFDNFKNVNDSYGHQTGDEVLKFFGTVLYDSFRVEDILGRVGGDEFMVFVTGEVDEQGISKRCENILHKLAIAKVGEANGFSCSIGVAIDNVGEDFETLYAVADRALYQAKENGKACFVIEYASYNK